MLGPPVCVLAEHDPRDHHLAPRSLFTSRSRHFVSSRDRCNIHESRGIGTCLRELCLVAQLTARSALTDCAHIVYGSTMALAKQSVAPRALFQCHRDLNYSLRLSAFEQIVAGLFSEFGMASRRTRGQIM